LPIKISLKIYRSNKLKTFNNNVKQ